ncbi:type I-MYXAN CRISPR-associated protein Cmx8 [Aphanothece sacrum]|uniref:CRISPR type MYXAN-associated protein Cmx8 n=1 Tax=Aphanothece sacrum FPU1 TaxID=1920663 RepID=A0A401INR9_APHSA|nr:type I-MYXAN CRISPR-associated protein Cmx8 [Aphanothece sacrum]GBF82866.1 CRISPR type MYXAN-associated protein Cmx8 [Aphanothece sacrum FPU1]GBF86257.1 CRISPR type MYXAN-associated protein Cmx8 [Aphanothece sacrum FPU3]
MKNQKIIELSYQLAELPSSQHRAGLAGLVLMVQNLPNQPWFEERENAIIKLSHLDEYEATLRMNLEGLKALLDFTYGAFNEERWTTTKDKKKKYSEDEIREVEKKDNKGKVKLVKEYRYTVVVPQGAFLPDWDESDEDINKRIWIKLWRDMLWNIVRGVPATRNPFNNRCDGQVYTQDAEKLWKDLSQPDKATGQSGNYYLGAMATTAENIPTKDIIRYQFLLHFAPFIFQIYRPSSINKDGNREFNSYAIVIPDVANLKSFCCSFPKVLKARDHTKIGYLPREALIDLAEEGALDFFILQDRIARRFDEQSLRKSILGAEIIHAEKSGNSIKFQSINYVEPISTMTDRYAQIKDNYWCPWFRKQRLLNLLSLQALPNTPDDESTEVPLWTGFDALLSRIPRKWLEDPYFSHDARQLFNIEILKNQGKNQMNNQSTKIRQYAEIVYQVCQKYVLSKLDSKYDLTWDKCQGNPQKQKEYNEKKTKIANEAFLAVRSRSESQAFIEYFVSTLYPFVKKDEFSQFAEDLFNKTDEIRVLTLLALSSQFSSSKKDESKDANNQAA